MLTQTTMPSNDDTALDTRVTVIRTTEQAVFDAIVDEALSSDPLASVSTADGVARITYTDGVTIAVLDLP